MPKTCQRDPEEKRFLQNFHCSTYHMKHHEERNAKTRARMAKLRAAEVLLPTAEQKARQSARRASAAKYRAKNSWRLAQEAREARAEQRELRERQRECEARELRRAGRAQQAAVRAHIDDLRQKRRERLAAQGLLELVPEISEVTLQEGERYVNMDYLVLNAVRQNTPKFASRVQYSQSHMDMDAFSREKGRHHGEEVKNYHSTDEMQYMVEDVHFQKYQYGCGAGDGEWVEQQWSELNPLASTTRQMGQGVRHDMLLQDFNDKKTGKYYVNLAACQTWAAIRMTECWLGGVHDPLRRDAVLERCWVRTFLHVIALAMYLQ
ncbi:hypothetical protein C8R43DRAFT_1127228 [Mycena crocata]|nr:hypothetical protein C8R43DRAFT_1127228 [Mycena crocata]